MKKFSRYLIISKANKSNQILHSNIQELLNSLNKSTNLKCKGTSIQMKNVSFECHFKEVTTEVQKETRKFFILVLELKDEKDIEIFESVDDEIANFIDTYSDLEKIVLEDAISQFYSKQAYELIHIIENKTRSLISEVMFLKSGEQNWESKLTKKLNIRDNKKRIQNNYKSLDGKYFSDLTTMLFSIYEGSDTDEESGQDIFVKHLQYLGELVSNIKDSDEISANKTELIKNAVKAIEKSAPRSIWDRYIASSVKNSDKLINSLGTVLKQLEKPRNDIAHNTVFRKKEYDSLKKDVDNIFNQLSDAIEDFESSFISQYTPDEKEEMFEITDEDKDDLTIIVPAQEDGFKQVFLTDNEWYDIRIGKAKRNKIQYIAGYEVAPRSGIQYIAKVKKIVPSNNYVGYWKVIFDGEPQKYDRLIPLGDTYPPQNIRYTTKKELDDVASGGGTLEVIFKNPY
ncbi:hypothetical protein ACTGJ2_00315 [Streptococcus suis]|uniref:hypothetical protein n=1 Tax=Streptococcus TaxID=1301 RepID=UPI000CF59279|nr:hypothetical protein [Streptococcus suis]MCL4923314.1 hypothetical protein [Streptococcus suis]MDD7565792.1 hypothetical protein [Streptococcus suis]MDY5054527.1 hypothetical protein [Streptococcus suis]HEM6577648.1 hypothetical protein [Streptococcus suis]